MWRDLVVVQRKPTGDWVKGSAPHRKRIHKPDCPVVRDIQTRQPRDRSEAHTLIVLFDGGPCRRCNPTIDDLGPREEA